MDELKKQGRALEILRKKANMTQEESAKSCGHGRAWLNEIEKGRSNISLRDARILVGHYGFDLNDYTNIYNSLKE